MPAPTGRRTRLAVGMVAATLALTPAIVGASESAAPPPAKTSAIDGPLLFQLLIGEMQMRLGQPGDAFDVILDAARRTRDEQLFRRSIEIAMQSRNGDQALLATRAWREAEPRSLDAVRTQLQVLAALNRLAEANEPLRALIAATPEAERAGLIAVLPRFVQRATDKAMAARLIEDVTRSHAASGPARVAALVAAGRAWAAADDPDRALRLAQDAHAADPSAPGPTLLALELLAKRPAAESIVVDHLQRPDADGTFRLAYARALTGLQRYADAVRQLEIVTRDRPEVAPPYLTLGALQLELRQLPQAEAALQRYLQLAEATGAAPPATRSDEDDDDDSRPDSGIVQARLLLAQAAEQRGDFAAAEGWLARIDDPRRALEVQTRRATLLARQGRLAEARDVVRRAPERQAGDARAKLVAEAGVLREVKRWNEAYEVLGDASRRFPADADLLYEQAMVAEKMNRLDEMERLLRRVIELKPDNAHAHNALGYSLADRSVRLPEARVLIERALELSPGDPFITDSLGWVEFRLGNTQNALRLLREAYAARPDVEIAAHLGEVLWSLGQRDEALRLWREANGRDAANEVLRETLARLKADL